MQQFSRSQRLFGVLHQKFMFFLSVFIIQSMNALALLKPQKRPGSASSLCSITRIINDALLYTVSYSYNLTCRPIMTVVTDSLPSRIPSYQLCLSPTLQQTLSHCRPSRRMRCLLWCLQLVRFSILICTI